MRAAVREGDAKKLAELMRHDPGFNTVDGLGNTLLHVACFASQRSVIPLLLAHPDVDVNAKNKGGWTPFYGACLCGITSCVCEMLRDSRVKVNEPNDDGHAPLWHAAYGGHLDVIKWWIASGREIDLGKPGDVEKTDAIGAAKEFRRTEVVTLLERFKSDATQTRHAMRVEVGWYDKLAAEMFAQAVFVSDGLLQIKNTTTTTPAARFFSIARRLPLELQMVLCHRVVGSGKELIPGKDREVTFKTLAKSLLWSSIFTS